MPQKSDISWALQYILCYLVPVMFKSKRSLATAIFVVAASLTASMAPAQALPRATLAEVEKQVDALQEQAQNLGEDYVEALHELESINQKIAVLTTERGKRAAQYSALSTDLNSIIRTLYKTGTVDLDIQAMISSDPSGFLSRLDAISIVGSRQAATLRRIASASVALQQTSAELKAEQKKAKAVAARALVKKKAVEAKLAQAQKLLKSLKAAERKKYYAKIAAEKRRQAAQKKSLASKISAVTRNKKLRKVLTWALNRVGGSYRLGAAGPRSFDCSGFTMMAYRQIGVYLPHSSRAQMGSVRHVSRSQLRAGDLVFFFRYGIRHIGMYIGGNRFVHAENYRTGIRISSLSESYYVRHLSGFGRPLA
jgi:cell wall-associated NlpC family hydrolase